MCYTDDSSHVVLLTNDVNLRNKGLVMQIECYCKAVSHCAILVLPLCMIG